jgi:preprotein translocase subunit SecF
MSDTATSTPSPLDDSSVDQSTQPRHSWLSRLYTGTGAFEIVGRRRFYYVLTGVIVLICLLSFLVRGFTLGIDFEGGTRIALPAADNISTEQVETVYRSVPRRSIQPRSTLSDRRCSSPSSHRTTRAPQRPMPSASPT